LCGEGYWDECGVKRFGREIGMKVVVKLFGRTMEMEDHRHDLVVWEN
jgi:hypothetical protein